MKKWYGKSLILTIGVILLLGNSFPLVAQASSSDGGDNLVPRWVPAKPAHTEIMSWQSRDVIELKFIDGSAYRLVDGQMMAGQSDDLATFQNVLSAHPVEGIERLFSQSEASIAAEWDVLQATALEQLPDLNLWYHIRVAEGTDPEALIDALNALPEVEIAYPAPLPAPLPNDIVMSPSRIPLLATPNFISQQGYLNPATAGIDAKYAWLNAGGTGSNVTIVDVEYSFNTTHEDLPNIPLIGGQMFFGFGDDHGTAVLGELVAKRNGIGVTGIAYGAKAKFSSACMDSGCTIYNPANAINTARTNTQPGDLILLEQQTPVCGLSDYGPLEWIQSVYDATKLATAAKRIVVAAAGNGHVDLDQAGCLNKFNRSVRDSGAIIVGAGAAPTGSQTDRSRLSFSTFGSRLDVQGWGESVFTSGYGTYYPGSGKNEWYTASFNGTSSASPIVTGAAALLSSISQQRGKVQTAKWIRSTLANTGSPQQAHPGYPVSEKIGPRPNLKKAILKLEQPVPKAPAGTITDRTPTYKWTKVLGATNYQFQLWNGTTLVYTKSVGTAVCGTTTCSKTPTEVLGYATYKWRVRAKIDGVWKAWSAYKNFTVQIPFVPVPIAPKGTIIDRTPTYKWTKVNNATAYRYQLKQGTTIVYTKTTGSACGTKYCLRTPSNVLGYNSFKWHVRAKVGGVWRPWSKYTYFKVAAGFNSQFTSNANGWKPIKGVWSVGNGFYSTKGTPLDIWHSTSHINNYPTLTYEARMKRTKCPWCANNLIIRGTPTLNIYGEWKNGYIFQYQNVYWANPSVGRWSVWKFVNGVPTMLHDWTETSYINQYGWNTLKVTAKGNSFQFFINGHLIWTGSDPSLTTGQVGINMYASDLSTENGTLFVDWAKLGPAVSTADEARMFVPDLNLLTSCADPTGYCQ